MDKLAVVQSEETVAELEKINVKVADLIGNFNKLVDVTSGVGKNINTPKELLASQKMMVQIEKDYLTILEKKNRIELQLEGIQRRRADNADRDRVAEIQLQQRREKAVDDYSKKEQQAADRAQKSRYEDLKLMAQIEKKFDDFERKEQQAAQRREKESEKRRLDEVKLQQQREKAFDDYEKRMQKQQQMESAYAMLNQSHIDARNNAREMGIKHGIISREFLEAAAAANRFDQQLKRIDGALGQFNRNVGNYKGNMWGLSSQMQQVMREMPNFAMDARIGIMSLTNNLPYLGDAIENVVKESKIMKAEFLEAAAAAKANAAANAIAAGADEAAAAAAGKHAEALVMQNYQAAKAPSIWKQLAASVFNWQTLLVVGISLVMMYNKEITEWTKSLFRSNDAAAIAARNAEALNNARKEATKSAASEISQLEILYRVATNEALSREQRLRATDKLQKLYPSYFKNLSDEQIMVGGAISKYLQLRDAITASAMARASEKELEKRSEERLGYNTDWETRYQKEVVNMQRLRKMNVESILVGNQMIKVTDLINQSEQRLSNMRSERFNKRKQEQKEDASIIKNIVKNQDQAAPYEADKYGANPPKEKKAASPKTKKPTASNLSAEQRDYLNELQAIRDNEIAAQKQFRMDGKINEAEYWQEYIKIVKKYRDAVSDYLTGKNAKEKATEAATRRKAIEEIERANKEIYDFEYKQNEEAHKIRIAQLQENANAIENTDYLSSEKRLESLIENDNAMLDESRDYWQKQIELAVESNQDILEIQRKRDEDLNKITDQRDGHQGGLFKATTDDLNKLAEFEKTLESLTIEEKKAAILSNERLSTEQKNYRLKLIEKEEQQRINELEIERLKSLRAQYAAKLAMSQIDGFVNPDDLAKVAELDKTIKSLENANIQIGIEIKNSISEEMASVRDIFANMLDQIGLPNFADAVRDRFAKMFNDLKEGTLDWKDATVVAASAVADVMSNIVETSKNKRIAALDEELKRSEENSNQEISFIEKRIEWINSLGELNREQIEERNALEDQARVIREQQAQRERLIATQKAKAEQRAAAQQALIQGLLGAAKSIPNWAQVAASIAAGALMAGLIMSKDPTPKYFVGREGGKAEWAWTQEKGREIIADKSGNIKSFGSDNGAEMTWLDEGDKVYTAERTKKILNSTPEINYTKIAKESLVTPLVISKTPDNSEKIIDGVGNHLERVFRKYDKPVILEDEEGNLIKYDGNKIPEVIGKRRRKPVKVEITRNGRI